MPIAKISCPDCQQITKVKKSLLIPKFGQTVKIKCRNEECQKVFNLKIDQGFAAKVDLFSMSKTKIENPNKTVIELPKSANSSGKSHIAYLVDERTGEKYKLQEGINVIGRYSQKTIRQTLGLKVEDTTISRIHFQIDMESNHNSIGLYVKDLDSKNHTYLNTEDNEVSSIEELSILNGDVLLIGHSKFRVLIE